MIKKFMMQSKCVGASLLLIFATANANADQCDISEANKQTADTFFQSYHDRLSRGLNRDQLRPYLSVEQNKIVDSTIFTLVENLEHKFPREAQRLMDSYGVQAACQALTLKEAKVWGAWTRYGTLSYDITPTCSTWTNNKAVSINLKFNKTLCTWVITDFKNEVAYK